MIKKLTKFIVSMIFIAFVGSALADLSDGLVAYYPFNGDANDVSGNENNGTLNGPVLVQDKFGIENSAYLFDGIGDSIEYPNSGTLDSITKTITVAAWVKFDNISGGQPILGRWPLAYLLYKDASDRWTWNVNNNPATVVQIYKPIETNKWYHVVGVADSVSARLYIDGILVGTSSIGVESIDNQYSTNLRIGYEQTAPSFFNGTIDEVFIYSRALSVAEIKTIYYQGNPPVIKGSAPWGTPHTVTCKNITQNATVIIPKTKSSRWDCEKAGLPAQAGDKVKVTIEGTKY